MANLSPLRFLSDVILTSHGFPLKPLFAHSHPMTTPYDHYGYYDYDTCETQSEIQEELTDFNLGMALCSEDGWFYDDEGVNNLPHSDDY
jgi:hypothetical protein